MVRVRENAAANNLLPEIPGVYIGQAFSFEVASWSGDEASRAGRYDGRRHEDRRSGEGEESSKRFAGEKGIGFHSDNPFDL